MLPRSVRAMRAVTVCGIAVAVASLVVATAIGRGFESEYRRALLDFNAHVAIVGTGEIAHPKLLADGIDAIEYRSDDERGFARGWGWCIPWHQGMILAFDRIEGLYNLMLDRLDKYPQLGKILQVVNPKNIKSIVPRAVARWSRRMGDISGRGFEASTPFIYREALAIGAGNIRGVVVKGVDQGAFRRVHVMEMELFGDRSSLEGALTSDKKVRVVAGRSLASALGVAGEKGDIKLLIPREGKGDRSPYDFKDVEIAGVFESGMHDYDDQFILMSLGSARRLFGIAGDRISGVEIRLDDAEKAPAASKAIEARLGPAYRAITWSELNRELLIAVRLEKFVSGLIMGIMVVVAALNIIACLVLLSIHRSGDISALKAIGAEDGLIKKVFVRGGVALGSAGAAIGIAAGAGLASAIGRFDLIPLDAEIYLIGALPIDISPMICGILGLFCIGISYATSLFASKRLAAVPIVEGLKNT